jgi:putative flippase GtrA
MKRFTKHLIIRYIISGGTSAAVNLAILSILYYIFHVYYILASVISFLISFFISLILQKFWTFQDKSTDGMHLQIGKYLLSSLFGLSINTFLLYVFVDHVHFYVFFSQILAGLITACVTFFISRDYIFNTSQIL